MGWFKKKSDPISERTQALNKQIEHLEAQIRELSTQQSAEARAEAVEPSAAPAPAPAARRAPARPPRDESYEEGEAAPKLRSTALPQGHPKLGHGAGKPAESGLEDLSRNPFKEGNERGAQPGRDLGMRETDFSGMWKRFKRQFRGPATSNPKLVSYLAAGSIQGLRPLRYEKRVARNRTILLLVCFVLILWGILAIVIR